MIDVVVHEVAGIPQALVSMRYSFKSATSSDDVVSSTYGNNVLYINQEDRDLLIRLINAGDSHAKVTRMMQVWAEFTLPRYMWSEFDTYKVGTTAMSESTVHTLTKDIKSLSVDDFHVSDLQSLEYVGQWLKWVKENTFSREILKETLPESFLQKRMVNLNYQTIRHMYFDRRKHRLQVWRDTLNLLLMQLPFPVFITTEV